MLRCEAHGLKGAAGNMAAHQLSSMAREVERYADAGCLEKAAVVVDRLGAEADAVIRAVQAFEASSGR
jgi:hypothetical protein